MIAQQDIEAIAAWVEQRGLSEAVIGELRGRFPGQHFTYCMDDDIVSAKPVLERSGFRLYLVDSRDHCSRLTDDAGYASGVVLAEVLEE